MSGFNPLELQSVQRAEMLSLLAEYQRRRGMRLVDQLFPDQGPNRRDLYQKHVEFFDAGEIPRAHLHRRPTAWARPWAPAPSGPTT
jgi:hypothetical protein